MTQYSHPFLIGVDGGGTSCRFALLHGGQRVDVRMTAANASTDMDGTLATIAHGLDALAEAAGMPLAELALAPAVLGLAGVMTSEMGQQIAHALPLHHAVVCDDRRTAMVGALGSCDGCVMGIGTGSFMGRRAKGHERLIGGWGFVLGDDASGAVLGRQALRCALDVHDGVRSATALTSTIYQRLRTPADIVAFAATAKPNDFATFAPDVVAAAQEGDPIGLDLMQSGAKQIERVLRHLGWKPGERICPLGGVAPHYAPYLSKNVAAQLTPADGSALDGALALAAQLSSPQ